MKRILVLIGLTILVLSGSFAQEATWVADKAHTQVMFTISHLVIADVTGRFSDFDIILKQKDEDFSGSGLSAHIKT
ncbi:MAG: YceI family protein, partial [Bacteroidota bacterium]